ncbi:MAG TPA: hypothetical protein VLA75_04380 [Thermoanaerobaculia bacterium]|nr:hypothetical protein [Thermoanaerobaculia bacterium]
MRMPLTLALAALLAVVATAAAPPEQQPAVAPPLQLEKPVDGLKPIIGLVRVTVAWPPAECGQPPSFNPCSSVRVTMRRMMTSELTERPAKAKPGSLRQECIAEFTGALKHEIYRTAAYYSGPWKGATHCSACKVEAWVAFEQSSARTDVTIPLLVRNAVSPYEICPLGSRLD